MDYQERLSLDHTKKYLAEDVPLCVAYNLQDV